MLEYNIIRRLMMKHGFVFAAATLLMEDCSPSLVRIWEQYDRFIAMRKS